MRDGKDKTILYHGSDVVMLDSGQRFLEFLR